MVEGQRNETKQKVTSGGTVFGSSLVCFWPLSKGFGWAWNERMAVSHFAWNSIRFSYWTLSFAFGVRRLAGNGCLV